MLSAVDAAVVWSFLLLWLVIVPTPGANSLMVTHAALTRPAAHVAFAILGNVVGVLALAMSALLGWAALLDQFPWLRSGVNLLGGGYLIYFGGRLLLRAHSSPAEAAVGEPRDKTAPREAIKVGLVTALSNAQAILFITSIFAASGVLAASRETAIAVLAIIAICNVTYLAFLGWVFQSARVRAKYQRFRRGFEGSIGVLFVGFGGRLMWRELLAL